MAARSFKARGIRGIGLHVLLLESTEPAKAQLLDDLDKLPLALEFTRTILANKIA